MKLTWTQTEKRKLTWIQMSFVVYTALLTGNFGKQELHEYRESQMLGSTVLDDVMTNRVAIDEKKYSCWRECHRTTGCTSYFEHTETGRCRMMSSDYITSKMNETGWKYYVKTKLPYVPAKRCPRYNGYTYDHGTRLCFKLLSSSKLTRSEALKMCLKEGCVFLKIRNDGEQNVVAGYLSFYYPDFSPCIDGRRPDNDGPYIFQNDVNMTYFKWMKSEPEPFKRCIKMSKNDNYEWASHLCSSENQYLCQIDME